MVGMLSPEFPMMPLGQPLAPLPTPVAADRPQVSGGLAILCSERRHLLEGPMCCFGFSVGHFHSIFIPSPGRTGIRGSQRPWTQTDPRDYFPFIPWPGLRLLSQASNSCSAGGQGGGEPGCQCQQLLGIQSMGRSWSPPRTGQLAEPGDHLPVAGPPAQTAVDCLILWKLTRVGEVGMDMARATRARIECLSCHRCHLFRMAERTCGHGAEHDV